MKKELLELTIAIPVKNEEKNLSQCLSSIGNDLAEKIAIIDSGSYDKTKEIALQHKANFIDFKWDGKFPKKRNWFLQNHTPTTKWVLFLDADEYLTENFKTELRHKLSTEDKKGYWLSYSRYFLGKKLKGGYPLRKLALFRVGYGEYEYIEEDNWSKLDMEVHEHPLLNGEVGVIKSEINHQDFKGISSYITQHNEYASWEAFRFLKTLNDRAISSKWTWKQRLKYRLMRTALIGPAYFIGSYLLMGGFLDGARGWAFAVLKMSYFTQIYCKIKELKSKP